MSASVTIAPLEDDDIANRTFAGEVLHIPFDVPELIAAKLRLRTIPVCATD